jgi:hypothetical protein
VAHNSLSSLHSRDSHVDLIHAGSHRARSV